MKLYKKPIALGLEDWNEWRKATRKQFPIQYFFRETLTVWFSSTLVWPVGRTYWKFMHRFVPRYRYHIIKPRSLEPGYHDPDSQIRAAAFDILSVYAEKNLMGDGVDGTTWSQEDIDNSDADYGERGIIKNQIEREAKVIALRNWWVNERPARVEPDFDDRPDGAPFMWVILDKYKETPELKAFREWSNETNRLEEEWAEEDNRKFKELVDLLPSMWY